MRRSREARRTELLVVVVDPAAAGRVAIEAGDPSVGKEAGEDGAAAEGGGARGRRRRGGEGVNFRLVRLRNWHSRKRERLT